MTFTIGSSIYKAVRVLAARHGAILSDALLGCTGVSLLGTPARLDASSGQGSSAAGYLGVTYPHPLEP